MRRLSWLFPALLLMACSPAYAGDVLAVAAGFFILIFAAAAALLLMLAGGSIIDVKADRVNFIPGWLCIVIVLVLIFGMPAIARADTIPDACKKYRRDLVRIAHLEMGLDAPIATLAAQMHQESRCNANARSPVGAEGMMQLMPATSKWLATLRRDLGNPQPLNPLWNMRTGVGYDVWLLERVQARGPCEKWAMALSAYNGGLGWLIKDKRLASSKGDDPLAWFNSVERHNSGRSAASYKENRHYSRVIMLRWEPLYEREGWGNGVCS